MKERAYEQFLFSPKKFSQVNVEIDCLLDCHMWSTTFDPNKPLDKKTAERTFCKRCGVYYHIHKYKH
jgi:hypothetical protein